MNDGLIEVLEFAASSARGIHFLDRREREQYLTYSELLQRARSFAGGLQSSGIRPGDRVGIILPTSPAFFDAFFGALAAGAIPVPLYPPVRLGRMDEYSQRTAAMLRASRTRIVITDRITRRVLGRSIASAAPELGCVIGDDIAGSQLADVTRSIDDIAFVQFSSGSTVAPKPIALSTRQVRANAGAIQSAVLSAFPEQPGRPHVCVSWLPLYHDMGLIGAVITAMSARIDQVLIPPELFVAKPLVWLRALTRHRGTISLAPNFAYSLCVDRIKDDDLADLDLSNWLVSFNGAEPVSPGVLGAFVDRFAACGLPQETLTPVYGLAESTLAVTFSKLNERFRLATFERDPLLNDGVARPANRGLDLVNLGQPVEGSEIRIADEKGVPLEGARVGRVLVRGASVMSGYDGLPELTKAVIQDGWLDTGDMGFQHKDDLYLFGRSKDIIILHGCNHAPQEIEQCLDDVEGIRRGCVAAIGVSPADGLGEQLVILAEKNRDPADITALEQQVSHLVTARTGLVPSEIRILQPGTLPRTSSGKIRRSDARRQFLSNDLTPPKRISMLSLLGEILRSWWSFARLKAAS